MAELTEQQALKEREKYVMAFNDTMVKIWKEQILLLDVIDTGALLNSPVGILCDKDERITTITLSQSFLEYGLWQNYGTGREVARGNPGDIGRAKVRERRRSAASSWAWWPTHSTTRKCARTATTTAPIHDKLKNNGLR